MVTVAAVAVGLQTRVAVLAGVAAGDTEVEAAVEAAAGEDEPYGASETWP